MNKPKKPDGRKNNGGKREGSGRKSREELRLPPVKPTTVEVEPEVIVLARKNHKTIGGALRFAAKYGPDDVVKKETGQNE
jgi:hypothetical protein